MSLNSTATILSNSTPTTRPEISGFTTSGILKALAVAVLIVVAIAGNAVVCASFTMFGNLRSLTNYYIVSLSISDLLVALCVMPIWLIMELHSPRMWLSRRTYPLLWDFWSTMDVLLCLASVLSLTAVSVERNLAITNPFSYTKLLSPARVLASIGLLWLVAIAVATVTTVNPFGQTTQFALFILLCSYFLPVFILLVMYSKIFFVARRQARRMRQNGAAATDHKAIKTIAIVVGAYIVCFTPFFVVVIWTHFQISIVAVDTVSIVKWLAYFNSCLNPFIYSLFNKTYREAFKRLFRTISLRMRELRHSATMKKRTSSRPVDRSRLSLNITMRSSAGSLLDGPKATTDGNNGETQSRSTRFSQASMNLIDPNDQKAKACDIKDEKLANEQVK